MSNQTNPVNQIISLPQGGGALTGIGEKFSPDLHTGTGNFIIPIGLPPGRNGFTPELNLSYSTGNGNGPYGLGWSLNVPGISRKTSDGVPEYHDIFYNSENGERRDVFILSGAEDLVPVALWESDPNENSRIKRIENPDQNDFATARIVQFQPRTEGLFTRIFHFRESSNPYWRVESKDGLVSIYGSLPTDTQAGILAKLGDPSRVFAWKLTSTNDPFGNRICYEYTADPGKGGNQLLLKKIKYVDYGNNSDNFLIHVDFDYEERPDPFSDHRAGFEIRTTQRCKSIRVSTHTSDGDVHPVREYRFTYNSDAHNGISFLKQVVIIGFDDAKNPYEDDMATDAYPKQFPPLTFGYTQFEPERRQFDVVQGHDLPTNSLAAPFMELVDLHGNGLPDILEMSGTIRYWRNLGNNRFDMPRTMQDAPPHSLADPGVQMFDANGDGLTDILVTSGPHAGYYPLEHGGRWSNRSFQRYANVPGFNLDDPEVKLVDLDGDGFTDILRSGSRMEGFFNDPDPSLAWKRTAFRKRQNPDTFPDVSFADPRVRLADMNGDGLQDIVMVHNGKIEYWPNQGNNTWGSRIRMLNAPHYPQSGYEMSYDPKRILLGDLDGDGLADLIYVDNNEVRLWVNQSGNSWSKEPTVIKGTPAITSMDHVRLADLNGTGVSGLLYSLESFSPVGHSMMFLDFTGGVKPYVLNGMDNHMGAVTRVEYKPSTYFYLEDQKKAGTRWSTSLPFPVQVVAQVEVVDKISKGKLTTEYRYHHGHWDGAEREFRGFGMVEQLDTESFDDYHKPGLHGDPESFKSVNVRQFVPPLLNKTWFHQGPVGEEFGDWSEKDYSDEYWQDDPQLLDHTGKVNIFLANYNDRGSGNIPSFRVRRIKRDALRSLRGKILRNEVYALDNSNREENPYTVTEYAYTLREETNSNIGDEVFTRIFFPHLVSQRTVQWERGDDPMTNFIFIDDYDNFGQPRRQSTIHMPRLRKHHKNVTGVIVGSVQPNEIRILAKHSHTDYAHPQQGGSYIHDRIANVRTYELVNPPLGPDDTNDDLRIALEKQRDESGRIHLLFNDLSNVGMIGHQINYYDEPEYVGQPAGRIGQYGALTRSQVLVTTDSILDNAYGDRRPVYLGGTATLPANVPSDFGSKMTKLPNGYYTDALKRKISPKGLSLAMQDALGHFTHIEYDPYQLLPVLVTDAKGLSVSATYNMRLLQPDSITEPNGNITYIVYNPVGLPEKQYIVGMDAQGNKVFGGTNDKPEISFEYAFLNFEITGEPIYTHISRRVNHALDNLSEDKIESREYSDGYGRLIQTRVQAEELVFGELGGEVGLTAQSGTPTTSAVGRMVNDSVVVSGWDIFDNKGQVVEKYEPFFSLGWDFQPESEVRKDRHSTMFYDPRGQVIRTIQPDGSQQRTIFCRPGDPANLSLSASELESSDVPHGFLATPWESYTYDANDLASLTHPGNTDVPATHRFTPASMVLDGMGRACCSVSRNGLSSTDNHVIRSSYDIRGNLVRVMDAMGRTAFRHVYDLLDRLLMVDNIDSGRRTTVFDATGNLIEYRDSKGSLALFFYDELNRNKEIRAKDSATGAFTLRERIHYGDEDPHAVARQNNTLGRPVKHYDEAGLLEISAYDFKGNVLHRSRRTIKDDALANNWLPDWSLVNSVHALEDTLYRIDRRYDALNRLTQVTFPEDADGERKILTQGFNRAGMLENVQLGNDNFVQHIAYNAKGQRVLIVYGNLIMSRYAYDEYTYRLARLRTERSVNSINTRANTRSWRGNGQLLQDFSYSYDLAGNLTTMDENTQNCGITGSQHGRNRLVRKFGYDPTYRLISSTGRACKNIGTSRGPGDAPNCGYFSGSQTPNQNNAPDLTEHYIETFQYDPAGNMLLWHNRSDSTQWTRRFGMSGFTPGQWMANLSAASGNQPVDWGNQGNRLTSLGDKDQVQNHHFDANGNLIRQNNDTHHMWDHANRMIGYRVQVSNNNPSVHARYLYGADGMRVKKWVQNQQGHLNTSTYIDGIFEQHHYKTSSEDKTNNTIHIMDDQNRIAMVRIGNTLEISDASPRVQYHLSDHLGSSHVVIGGDSATGNTFFNREEYFPYGETSFGSFGKKRYRYAGKERDEESGFYYYGLRFLAPWLGRWVSCDPKGLVGGFNGYVAFAGNPVNFIDKIGAQAEPTEQEIDAQQSLPDTGDVCSVQEPQDTEIATSGPDGGKGGWANVIFKVMLGITGGDNGGTPVHEFELAGSEDPDPSTKSEIEAKKNRSSRNPTEGGDGGDGDGKGKGKGKKSGGRKGGLFDHRGDGPGSGNPPFRERKTKLPKGSSFKIRSVSGVLLEAVDSAADWLTEDAQAEVDKRVAEIRAGTGVPTDEELKFMERQGWYMESLLECGDEQCRRFEYRMPWSQRVREVFRAMDPTYLPEKLMEYEDYKRQQPPIY